MTAANLAPLRKVTLHAARSKEFPDGSMRHGYDFMVPLSKEGRIDLDAWKALRGECFAHRFWANEPTMHSLRVHRPGDRSGSTWTFEWKTPRAGADNEDKGFRFGDHAFKFGEYVSVREAEGDLMTFRVVSVGTP